jgi:hypothetical protein
MQNCGCDSAEAVTSHAAPVAKTIERKQDRVVAHSADSGRCGPVIPLEAVQDSV